MLHIFIDADACPVKDEVYKVARRYDLEVTLVAASFMRIPGYPWLRLEVVPGGMNAADDWIYEHITEGDIVVTADIVLASRCLAKNAKAISPTGRPFTRNNIGDSLATRELLSGLRETGEITGGPRPFDRRDRSRFLEQLDQAVNAIRREHGNQE